MDWMADAWADFDVQTCPGFEPFCNGRRWEDDDWPGPGEYSQKLKPKPGAYVPGGGNMQLATEINK